MEKIKVLAIMTDTTSVGHFRIGWPGVYIKENFSDEIDITIMRIEEVQVWDMITLSHFDIIHFSGTLGYAESANELFPMIQKLGVKLVMDIDDHWEVPKEYPAREAMLGYVGGDTDGIRNIARKVDHVTTTTKLFKKELLELNDNVSILPNGIDMSHRMWQEYEPSDKVRIGWLGSTQRYFDLERLKDSIEKLYADQELKGKFTFAQYGGDKRDNAIFEGEGFMYYPGCKAYEYGKYYSGVDITLAPLKENIYNRCKSEVKMVEAGMNSKVFVCQDYGIYPTHIKDGINGILVGDDDDWYTPLKKLILNESLRAELSSKLHDNVKVKFSLDSMARKRVQFYKSLYKKK